MELLFYLVIHMLHMKTLITCMGLLLLCLMGSSQVTYHHYLNSTVHWSWELSTWNHYEFDHYFVHGDTLQDGEWYYDIWNSRYEDGNVYSQHDFLLREDSTNHYFKRYSGDTAEWLWYTFNLNNIGDTMSSEQIQGSTYYTLVTAIDTVYIGSEPRRRFYGDDPLDIIVEGIGNQGYINNYLHCYFKDGGVWNFAGDCFYQNVDDLKLPSLEVFPNPCSKELLVKLPNNFEGGQVSFFDMNGKNSATVNVEAGINSVDVSLLLPGTYLLLAKSNDIVLRRMVFVEH